MTNPNPFVPKGSLLEQQSQRRSRLKLGVFCVIAVSSLGLVAMLIQGCKRDTPSENPASDMPTNTPSMLDATNTTSLDASNTVAMIPPSMSNAPTAFVPPPTPPTSEVTPGSAYEVAKGDTLGSIAKTHHVSLKDLQAANPGVDSKHLKIKQKLTIPASSVPAASAPAAAAVTGVVDSTAGETYTVKSGDSLTSIAKKHGTSIKALKAVNSLTTDHIKVSQKLKLPVKAAPAGLIVDPAPAVTPAVSTMSLPAPVK